jgi:hypothetical protein
MEAISGSVRLVAFCAFAVKERRPVQATKHTAVLMKVCFIFMFL